MSEQELPEAGSVWLNDEAGEVWMINDPLSEPFGDPNGVNYLRTGNGEHHSVSAEWWLAHRHHFTRLTPSQPFDVSRLTAAEVFELKKHLEGVQVFGKWEHKCTAIWERQDAEFPDDSRVWVCEYSDGYVYNIRPGAAGHASRSSSPFPTLSAAQAACDAVLRKAGVLLVD